VSAKESRKHSRNGVKTRNALGWRGTNCAHEDLYLPEIQPSRRESVEVDELGAGNDKEKRQEIALQKERILYSKMVLHVRRNASNVLEAHEIPHPWSVLLNGRQSGQTGNFMPIKIFGARISLSFFSARRRRRSPSIPSEFNSPSALSFYAPLVYREESTLLFPKNTIGSTFIRRIM
jgi:hypothetical protein